MSRKQTRARKRCARIERLAAEFSRARGDPADLADLLDQLATSDDAIWPIAQAASRLRRLDDSETAMVAQKVAPHLAGMTPGSVRDREVRRSVSSIKSQLRPLRPRSTP